MKVYIPWASCSH